MPVWVLLRDFIDGHVIKRQKRRRTVEVDRRMQVGEAKEYRERLKAAGLSGRIKPSFIERLNLTIRQNVSKLTRRTWGPTYYASELMEQLDWWRSYYHFGRYHESLEVKLEQAVEQKGRR